MSACVEIRTLLARYVDRELDAADVRRVDSHLAVCDACAEQARLLEREAELLRRALAEESVPERLGHDLWQRLHAPPPWWARFRAVRWYAAAAAAALVLAVLVGRLSEQPVSRIQLARVTSCYGPIEVQAQGGTWQPLGTYSVLCDGDRVRCGKDMPGGLVMNTNSRIDFESGTRLAFHAAEPDGPFRLALEDGRIHAELANLHRPLYVQTPAASAVIVAETEEAGRAEVELGLSGPSGPAPAPSEFGLLDGIHILSAACAAGGTGILPVSSAPAQATLEVVVYEGSVHLVNLAGQAVAVPAGERLVAAAHGPLGAPERFDAAARHAWWPQAEARFAQRERSAEFPAPALPNVPEHGPGIADAEKIFEPLPDVPPPPPAVKPAAPEAPVVEGPAAPANLVARPDLNGVLLIWKPVAAAARPIVEYGIYRRAPGDADFVLIGRLPVPSKLPRPAVPGSQPGGECIYRQDGLTVGAAYEYAVAAASRDDAGNLIEGRLSPVVTAAPADFLLYFIGTDGRSLATLAIDKFYDGRFRRQTFNVRKRDLAAAETGDIGEPRYIQVEPVPGVRHRARVDFSTGYHVVDIVTRVENDNGVPRKHPYLIIENDLGIRVEIPQSDARTGG